MWHYDEPVHSPTALIGYQLMRLARQRGVTVVLNGQGADEVNAGYHAYFRAHWTDLMHAGHWGLAVREVREYGRSNAQPYGPLLRAAFSHWLRCEVRRMPGFALVREPLVEQDRREPVVADARTCERKFRGWTPTRGRCRSRACSNIRSNGGPCPSTCGSRIATPWRIRSRRGCRFSTIASCRWHFRCPASGSCAAAGTSISCAKL